MTCVPVPHQPAVLRVMRGQRIQVIAVGEGIAEQRAVIGETQVHRIAAHVHDLRLRQCPPDKTGQHEIRRQLVHVVRPAAGAPLGLLQVTSTDLGEVDLAGSPHHRLIE